MKRKLSVLLFLIAFTSTPSRGCDVCGCSLGGNYFGILPLYNKNFVGVRWSQARFHSYIQATQNLPAQHSEDTYQKFELWGRYYLGRRVQLFAFIPYVYNSMDGTDQKIYAHGIGDVSIVANYVMLNTGNQDTDFKHMLLAGAGLKLPTGKFDLTDQGKIINRNFQMGTGSLDVIFNAVYTVRYRQAGMNFETGYKVNTRNRDHYLFGNQYRASAQLFFWQKAGPLSLLPHGGVYFEQAAMHKERAIYQVNTGGDAWLASGGLDIYVKRVTLGVNFQRPIAQHYNSDDSSAIASKNRWTATCIVNF